MRKPLAALAVIVMGLILLTQFLPTAPTDELDLVPPSTVAPRTPAAPPPREAEPLPPDVVSKPIPKAPDQAGKPEHGAPDDHESPGASRHDDVVVLVVGSDGTPRPGIKVVFLGSYLYAKFRTWPKATTGEDGLARIAVPPPREEDDETWIKAYAVVHGPSRIQIGIKLPQKEPARIVIPPTGALELELVGPDGRCWPWPTEIICRGFASLLPAVYGGRVLLNHVRLGQRFQITGGFGKPYGFDTTTVAGPTAAGETVRRRIRVVCRLPHLTGRIVDPDGRPIGDGMFGFQRTFLHSGKRMRGPILFTRVTAGGRFLLPLQESRVYRTLRVQWRRTGRVKALAELPLLDHYSRMLHQVGEIRLHPVALLARGRVRSASGAQLRHKVWVELHPNDAASESDWSARQLEDRRETFPLGSHEIGEPAGLYVETVDEDGRFEIHGAPLSCPFTLRARGVSYSNADRANVSPGTEDVEITVSRWGRILGRIHVSPEVTADELFVQAFTPAGRLLRSNTVMNDGRFFLPRIPAGSVTVSVLEPGADRPIASVQNVRVTAGKDSDDKRLENIDLRGAVKLMVLRVVDSSSRPIRGAKTFGWRWQNRRETDANGEVRFLASEAPVPCVVRARGFRPRKVKLQASQTVTLKPGIPVRLLLDFSMPIPPGLTGVVFLNHEHAHSPGSGTDKPAPVRKEISLCSRQVDLIAESPGKHEVTIFFEPDEVSAHVEGQVVVIQDQAKAQEFRIRFDPEKVRKALERVRMTLKTK